MGWVSVFVAEVSFRHGRGYRTGVHWLANDREVVEPMGCPVVPAHTILSQNRIEATSVLAAALRDQAALRLGPVRTGHSAARAGRMVPVTRRGAGRGPGVVR